MVHPHSRTHLNHKYERTKFKLMTMNTTLSGKKSEIIYAL
jgi:hypothetical protein